jgi:hypothetical protein
MLSSSLGNPRQLAAQLLNFGLILSTAFMVSDQLLPCAVEDTC